MTHWDWQGWQLDPARQTLRLDLKDKLRKAEAWWQAQHPEAPSSVPPGGVS